MEIIAMLSDYAQVDPQGKVSAIGLGWNIIRTPLAAHTLLTIFKLDWNEAAEEHAFTVDLVDEDGRPVLLPSVIIGEVNPIHVEGSFTTGRPPALAPGSELFQHVALNFTVGMQLRPGRYEYRVASGEFSGGVQFTVIAP